MAALSAIFEVPFGRLEHSWTDLLLRTRFALKLSPNPDPRIFLVGLEVNDFEGHSTTAAEYATYAEIIGMASKLGASAVGFDVILARGSAVDAQPVMNAARSARNVIFAEASLADGNVVRPFSFAAPEFPGGLINISSDPDGVLRHYRYGDASRQNCRPSLALSMFLLWQEALPDFSCDPSRRELQWKELGPDKKSLVTRKLTDAPLRLNFRSAFAEGWPRGFKYASVHAFREKYLEWLKSGDANVPAGLPVPGSLILVAGNAPGADSGPTSFSADEPLVMLHATALSDLMQGSILHEAGRAWAVVIAIAALVGFAWAMRTVQSLSRLVLLAALFVLAAGMLSALLLFRANLVVGAVCPASFIGLALVGEFGRRSTLSSLEKVRVRDTLGRYFSPRVLEHAMEDPDSLEPREADLAVLLTDIRNFTTITERFGTKTVFDLLNQVFEVQTRAVLSLDGSMEHFVGDQFLAYWGAPNQQADACDRAMQAGATMIRQLDELKASLPGELAELFGFGLAIHRGIAIVGNKGSRMRLDYGILGDIVNAAARVESLTKLYGVRWIITPAVLESLASKPRHRFLDRVQVKGRHEPMELIEVFVSNLSAVDSVAREYEHAWSLYAEGKFPAALVEFEQLVAEQNDRPSQVMAQRCRELMHAIPKDWDGVYALHDK